MLAEHTSLPKRVTKLTQRIGELLTLRLTYNHYNLTTKGDLLLGVVGKGVGGL